MASHCDAAHRRSLSLSLPQVFNLMRSLAGSLPSTAWLLALPQLISRICHSLSDVQQNVQSILVRLAEAFPQQVGGSVVLDECEPNLPPNEQIPVRHSSPRRTALGVP